jgi:tetratricopeptide (TPR) repeat protein
MGRDAMQLDFDKDLQSYFTDMEYLRDMFKDFVSTEKLPKRLIVFHGVGGVGKSSLLRMFRLHCKNEKIPVALASGDDAKSVLDIVTRWMEDLKEDGIKFLTLSKTLESYRAVQAKVESEAKKTSGKIGDLTSKTMATVGTVLGSMIPGIGAITGPLGGMGAEALTDWLRGFLSKPDIDLLLDPAKKLSADFLEDIAKVAEKKRMVLLLDTYEQMSALEDWVGEAAQKIHPNVLMVIAGRKLPDWNRVWSGWMMNAQVEELKPMTEEVMRELIRRYYATMRGGEPDPAQVEAIIRFARGLPMVVTSAVQLWVKYGMEDFQSVKAEIVANLVDRLMEGVPSSLIPALEAAAVVRWFDQPILRAVTKQEDVRDVYNELRRFPFVRSRSEGLALHDSVREMMDENLRVQDSERHAELHERAAVYFEKRLEKVTGEDAERLGLERLYHRIRADEDAGIKLFQEMAEELIRYRLVNRLRALLNDASMYPLERENSKLWQEYYKARLAHSELQFDNAKMIYNLILKKEAIEPKLKAYALCDLGSILSRGQFLRETKNSEEVKRFLSQSTQIVPLDTHLVASITNLANICKFRGEWGESIKYYEQAIKFFQEHDDDYGLVDTYAMKRTYHAERGEWKEMFATHTLGEKILGRLSNESYFTARFLGWSHWAWAFAGRYAEGEQSIKKELAFVKHLGDIASECEFGRDLAFLLSMQDKFSEADVLFETSLKLTLSVGRDYETKRAYILSHLGKSLIRQNKDKWDDGEKSLAESLKILEFFNIYPDIPEPLVRLGELGEIRGQWSKACSLYQECLELKRTARRHFLCAALTGIIRVKHAQGDIAAIPSLLAEAKQLAQQYEYNDHLASLRLTQGHLAWGNGNQNEAIAFYQHAMIYALRYNRFLLDELLSGRPQGTPLRPIIPYCLERGEEGRKILSALRDWWKAGVNDVGTPRPDTISPIPEGIPLLEAEKIAREREPGDGSMQRSVVEQLEAAL